MLRELLLSVASGVIVTLILQLIGPGGSQGGRAPRADLRDYTGPPPRRAGFFGGLTRFAIAVVGGLALAYVAAPFVFGRRFGEFGNYGRFNRFDRLDGIDGLGGIMSHTPMLILTAIGTIIVWVLLSAISRRQ